MLVMFFSFFIYFFATRSPSSLDQSPETLLPDRNLRVFYNVSPKIRGTLPKKNWGPKTCKISVFAAMAVSRPTAQR